MASSRVCAAILAGRNILLVHHNEGKRGFWTLPGGGVESNETLEAACVREVFEETGLRVVTGRKLWRRRAGSRLETCFECRTVDETAPRVGYDPEMSADEQVINAVAWRDLEGLAGDRQVRLVIQALRQSE